MARLSYYNPEGDWRVDVYTSDGQFSFTYLGYFEPHFEGDESDTDDQSDPERSIQSNFRCAVMSAPKQPPKRKEFLDFHDLIFFLIDIVLSGGEWR